MNASRLWCPFSWQLSLAMGSTGRPSGGRRDQDMCSLLPSRFWSSLLSFCGHISCLSSGSPASMALALTRIPDRSFPLRPLGQGDFPGWLLPRRFILPSQFLASAHTFVNSPFIIKLYSVKTFECDIVFLL